jgi:hypothetical protein
MLFGRQHENAEDEHGSEEHLDENAAADGPKSCAMTSSAAVTRGRAPIKAIAKVTFTTSQL